MTTYKLNIFAWSCFIVSGLLFILAALYISNWFVVLFFALILTSHFYFKRIKCPNCGMPVIYEGETKREGPFAKLGIPSAFFRKKCANCGWDLRKDA